MRSPLVAGSANGSGRYFFAPHKRARPQRGDQLVSGLETSRSQLWRNDRFKSFELHGGIGAGVHFRRLQVGVSKPERNFSEIFGGLQDGQGTGMSQYMRGHSLQ